MKHQPVNLQAQLRSETQLSSQADPMGCHAGLQMQTTDPEDRTTVENNVLRAACEAGMVLPSNATSVKRLHWSRSSRTDKGVHAQSTVCCLLHTC